MDQLISILKKEGYGKRLRLHRRALHLIPELGDEEWKTRSYLMDHLSALAPDDLCAFAGTGIRAVFRSKNPSRVIAFRSDMDALPIREKTGCSYASQHPGKMHACGHDGHMANLITFAEWLSAHREELPNTIVLLFQPAEETVGGAQRMVDEGALENPHVDVIYGMHMMPDIPVGKIAACSGPIMAQTCEMDFILHGKASHGAAPHLGRDVITAMGHLITLFQTTVSRSIDPGEEALITIGRIEAGEQRNILPDYARMEGIVRTFSNSVYDHLEACIKNDLKGIEAAFGIQTEFIKRLYFPCVDNDPAEFERVRSLLGNRFIQAKPKMTAEDFACYQLVVPGVFVFLGCMDAAHHSPLHADTFDFDEEALVPGMALFIKLAFERI